jgi:DNA-binding LacI/PurR family transcriptional regulator
VALVGFDDIMVSRYTVPALTTVAQPVEQMAEQALSYLFDRISRGRRNRRRRVARLATSAVFRESA